MRLLDKYILKAFVGPFLFGVFAFTSIFIGTGTLFRIAQYITEYGIHITDLEVQASKIIQQAIILDEYQVKYAIQYNFWNTGDNLNNVQNNYGLINYDYTPKPSYYAMKNYYENTNGAEYIGTVNIAEGLEGHVYDKAEIQ